MSSVNQKFVKLGMVHLLMVIAFFVDVEVGGKLRLLLKFSLSLLFLAFFNMDEKTSFSFLLLVRSFRDLQWWAASCLRVHLTIALGTKRWNCI